MVPFAWKQTHPLGVSGTRAARRARMESGTMTKPPTAKHVLWVSLLAPTLATAQERARGFSLDRFEPSERGSEWFALESLDFRGNNRVATGAVPDFGHKPLVLYDRTGEELQPLVENQLFLHLGASVVAGSRMRFALNVPVAPFISGRPATVGGIDYAPSEGASVGDARLGADARLIGEYGDPATAAVGVQVYLPSGDADAFSGDGKVRVTPRALLAGDVGALAYALRVSVNVRARDDDFAGKAFGNELGFAAALGARLLGGRLVLGPEAYGSTVVSDGGDGFFEPKTTPFEVVLGAHCLLGDAWRIGAGAGPGITRGLGTPIVRALGTIEWAPSYEAPKAEAKPSDRDHDGVVDGEDACGDVSGIQTADATTNGCPPPQDTDGDGISDPTDACIDVPGVAQEDPNLNGCPPDRDRDGVTDERDACPDVSGEPSGDPERNGCRPPRDADQDGIFDDHDACPEDPGPPDADSEKNGCPNAPND